MTEKLTLSEFAEVLEHVAVRLRTLGKVGDAPRASIDEMLPLLHREIGHELDLRRANAARHACGMRNSFPNGTVTNALETGARR